MAGSFLCLWNHVLGRLADLGATRSGEPDRQSLAGGVDTTGLRTQADEVFLRIRMLFRSVALLPHGNRPEYRSAGLRSAQLCGAAVSATQHGSCSDCPRTGRIAALHSHAWGCAPPAQEMHMIRRRVAAALFCGSQVAASAHAQSPLIRFDWSWTETEAN